MPSVVEGRSSLPFARLQTPKTSKTLRGSFDQALRPLPSVVQGVQACRLKPKTPKTLRGSLDQALRPLPSVVKGIQGCRLPRFRRLTRLKPSAAASRQLRPGTRVKGVLLFARLQTPKTPKTLRGSFDGALRSLPSVVKGV